MKRFKNILFIAGIDDEKAHAFQAALELAGDNQSELTILACMDESESGFTDARDKLAEIYQQANEQNLARLVELANEKHIKVEGKIVEGKPFLEIIREVIAQDRDLVIKTVEDESGLKGRIFGGTDMKLLRKCPCPLWLIKSSEIRGDRDVLVGLDYQPGDESVEDLNRQLLEMAASLALSSFSKLHVLHAWSMPYENRLRSARLQIPDEEIEHMRKEEEEIREKWLEELIQQTCGEGGNKTLEYLKPELMLVHGDAREIIPSVTESLDIELLVLGTVGRAGIPGLLIGNTAEAVLNQVGTSVLAIKPAGFESPVQ